jgi:hypothetical protein
MIFQQPASEQQVRNATIRMLDPRFPDFIIAMSETAAFKECTLYLTQERRLSAFDQELVVRFYALKNRREKFRHDVSDFLTKYMEDVADNQRSETFDYAKEEACFGKTFEALKLTLGEYSFAFANRSRTDLSAGFSVYHFEAITIGLQAVLGALDLNDAKTISKLEVELRAAKLDPNFIAYTTGGGKNSPGPLAQRIDFVSTRLTHAFT